MKIIRWTIPLFVLLSVILKTQSQTHFKSRVQCFYDRYTDQPLVIYDSRNGKEIVELPIGEEYCNYKLIVSKTKKGWIKIYKLIGVPECSNENILIKNNHFKGYWVKVINFKLFSFFPPIGTKTVNFYSKPSKKSNIIFKLTSYKLYQLIETRGLWAKVSFNFKGKKYTSCPNEM